MNIFTPFENRRRIAERLLASSRVLMTLTVFFCSFAVASAQEELTVYEGTGTNSYVPVYGFYAEHYNKCEFIIPASVLSETMTGGEISKMSFYLSSPTPASDSWGSASFKVFLKEVSSTAISTFSGTDDATIVYEGALDGSGSTMDILFSNNYTYDGGNLLVGVYQTVIGSYKSASFYGQTVSDASISGYSSNSLDAINATQRNFIPKTTFTYIPRGDVYYFKPKDLTAGGISDVEATLSWNISSSASGVTGFSYQYKTAVAEWGTDETTLTGTSVTLSGLTPQTEYDFRIKANYDGSSSDWCALSFRTTVAGMSVGDSWNDDFESSSCSWELVNGNLANKWFWGDAVSNDGEKSLYISNDGGTSHAYSNYKTMVYATKPLSFTEGKYEFSYDWKAYGESNFDFMRVALVPGSVELAEDEAMPSGFSTTSLPAGWIALDGGSKLNQSTEWQHNTVAVNAAGIYYLAFAWRNDGSGGNNPPAAVDNVSVRHIVCSDEAVGFNITDITTNSATFAWQGSAGQWQVTYSTNGNFKDATSIIVDDLTYTITDLSPDTHYYVRVRACCDDNDYGTWSDVLQFYTDCVTITKFPWTENFDGYTIASSSSSRTLPNCWAAINTSTNSTYKIYPTIHKSSASTSNCLYFLSSYSPLFFDLDSRDQYVILPQMDNLDGKRITLNAKGDNTNSTFKIGMMTDPTDVSTFTEIATQDGLTVSYQAFEYQLEDKGQYVAIMIEAANSSNSQNGVFIDDITIDDFPVKPKDLTVNYTVGTTAEVSWTSTESAWDIDVNGSVTSNVTNPYTLTDLEYATKYTVKVRASRGEEISNWSDSVCFTTTISCPAPTDLAVTLTSGNGTVAALSWTENGTATAWEVAYKVEGAIEFTETDADSNPFTLTNLTPETTYTAKVRAVNSDGEKSEWSDCVSFTPTNAYFITLNDGTDTNASIPVYNFLCNMGNRSQFIIPSTSLADLQWASLNKLTFYSPEESFDYGTAEFDAFMTEVDYTTFSSATFEDWNNLTNVYKGSITLNGNQMVINFATPYYFEGGNLLIGFQQTGYGNSGNFRWYGVSNNNNCSSLYQYSFNTEHIYSGNPYQAYFLPKVTIHYTPGEPPAVLKPKDLRVNYTVGTTAEVSWTSTESAWDIYVNGTVINNVVTNIYTLTGLEYATTYTVKVRARNGDAVSSWTNPVNFTTTISCPAPTGFAAKLTPGNGTEAALSWTENGTATAWEVAYKVEGETEFTETDADSNPFTLTSLTPETTYIAKVRAVNSDGEKSEWSDNISFTPTDDYTVTVNDGGTASNGTVPVYGYYADYLIFSQFIIPADDLDEVKWGTIEKMTFYTTNNNNYKDCNWGDAEFEVYMCEVDNTNFLSTELVDWDSMEKVMDAGTLSVSDHKMLVTLDTPYHYLGGNLLIGFRQTTDGTYKTAYWQGVTATGTSIIKSIGGYSDIVKSSDSFLPKTTFTYIPGVMLTEDAGVAQLETYSGRTVEVSFTRPFSQNVASTVCLPFSMTGVTDGTLYEFVDVTYDDTEGWVATMEAANLAASPTVANKPYLFMPGASDDNPFNVTFSGTIASVPATVTAGSTTSTYSGGGEWAFQGTYTNLVYGTDLDGKVFGFAATSGLDAVNSDVTVQAGEFVRAADGATIKPFRAYLTYTGEDAALQAPGRDGSGTPAIPDRIKVRLLGSDGTETAVGTMDMRTGDVTIGEWYDVYGRRLEGAPVNPGLYLNNSRKVMVK